jgi:uncharacterized membrane protein
MVALSDGIFAIAMTLLALDVRVPPGLGPEQFHEALEDTLAPLAAYALSFFIVSIFWRDQRQILLMAARTGGLPQYLALAVLGVIALVPFPTSMLADYGAREPWAVVTYAVTICVIDLLQLGMFAVLRRRHGVRDMGEWRDTVADLGVTVLVFGISVPIAVLAPQVALWSWLVLFPAKVALGRRERRRAVGEGAVRGAREGG